MNASRKGLETVSERIDRVERELASFRRQRVLLILILGACLLSLSAVRGSTKPETISAKQVETQELVIRDEKGVLRAALTTAESWTGGPHSPFTRGPATSLSLFDSSGAARIELLVGPDGVPSLRLTSADHKSLIQLEVIRSPVIDLFDQTHQLSLYGTPNGTAGLTIWGPKAGDRIALRTDPDSSSSLEMRRGNQVVVYLGDSGEEGGLPTKTGPRLQIFDTAGKILHEAPR